MYSCCFCLFVLFCLFACNCLFVFCLFVCLLLLLFLVFVCLFVCFVCCFCYRTGAMPMSIFIYLGLLCFINLFILYFSLFQLIIYRPFFSLSFSLRAYTSQVHRPIPNLLIHGEAYAFYLNMLGPNVILLENIFILFTTL